MTKRLNDIIAITAVCVVMSGIVILGWWTFFEILDSRYGGCDCACEVAE